MMIHRRIQYVYYQVRNVFKPPEYLPKEYRRNFNHFFYDYAYFGILNGSLLAFLTIYMARLGASGVEVGLIAALPAIVNLVFAIPAGKWLAGQDLQKSLFVSAFFSRLGYVLLIPIPLILSNFLEIRVILLITFLMSIPAAGLAIGSNAIFAEAVPINWRGYVSGIRNAIYALMTMVSTFASGLILENVKFPFGYQVVFLIGASGAMLSTYHLGKIKIKSGKISIPPVDPESSDLERPEIEQKNKFRGLIEKYLHSLHLSILHGNFGRTMVLLLLFHVFQYLAIPVMTVFQVNVLKLTDQVLSIGNVSFFITMFITSTRLSKLTARIGSQKITGLGVVILGLYPVGMVISRVPVIFYLVSLIGGIGWGLAWGSLYNYLLEKVPGNDKTPYLAWYTIILNFAILFGSLMGPVIASFIGMEIALIVFTAGRLLAGWLIYREG